MQYENIGSNIYINI